MRATTAAIVTAGPRVPRLVGRDAELLQLSAALDRAAAGAGGLVVLRGESGTGKTRLAHEAMALARAGGFRAVEGRAHALSKGRAYGAVADAVGPLLRGLDRGELVRLAGDLPQLGMLFGGLGLASPEPLGDAALERARLLDGLVHVCRRLSRQRPLLVLIDDLHAADRGTLEFLHLARRGLAESRVLLLATRLPGAGDTAALDALAEAPDDLAGWSQTLAVNGLDRASLRRLIEVVLGGQVTDDLVNAVVSRSQGLPLLALSLAEGLDAAGGVTESEGLKTLAPSPLPLPAAVRDHVRSRLRLLSAPANTVLELLATAGGRLEHAVLTAAADIDQGELLDALAVLEQRGLVAVIAGGYAVSSALLSEAVVDDLSPLHRQRCHARLADAVAGHLPDDPRIASHLLAAGALVDPDRALTALAKAGRLGPTAVSESTVRDLETAVALAGARGRTDLLADLLADLGDARGLLGDLDGARRAWEAALAEHIRSGEAVAAAELHRRLAMLHWDDGALDRAQFHLDEAERQLAGLEPSPVLGRLLLARAITRNRLGDPQGAAEVTARLLQLAERFGSSQLAAAGHLTMVVSEMAHTDYLAATAAAERGRLAAVAARDTPMQQRAHDCLSLAAAAQGRLPEFRTHSLASLELARQLGATPLELWPRVRLAIAELLAGSLDAALRTSTETLVLARRLDQRRGLVGTLGAHAWILVSRGQLDQARGTLAEADTISGEVRQDRNVHGTVEIAQAALALAQGDAERALDVAGQFGNWHQTLPLTAAGLLGEAQVAVGATAQARATAARIRAVRSCATDYPRTVGCWIDGLAAFHDGEAAAATQLLREAVTGFEQLGMALAAARARLAWARADTDGAAAVDRAKTALAAFERVGAAQDAAAAREWLRARGVIPSRGRRGGDDTGSQLTSRQFEIARLVATGLTNAEIGEGLFISPRTVTTQLDRIYALLGLSSRAALTRYLADAGLLGEELAHPRTHRLTDT